LGLVALVDRTEILVAHQAIILFVLVSHLTVGEAVPHTIRRLITGAPVGVGLFTIPPLPRSVMGERALLVKVLLAVWEPSTWRLAITRGPVVVVVLGRLAKIRVQTGLATGETVVTGLLRLLRVRLLLAPVVAEAEAESRGAQEQTAVETGER